MAFKLHCFRREDQAVKALTAAVAQDLRLSRLGRERSLLLVSGGRSPLSFFSELANQDLPWHQIDVSLVDDRCLPFDHADSNARLVVQNFLVGPAQKARWLTLLDWKAGENRADASIFAQNAVRAANANLDFIDPSVVVLGIGLDGHTASLFSDARQWPEAITTKDRYVAVSPSSAPYERVSLSLNALINQRVCYVGSGGSAKWEVIKQIEKTVAGVACGVIDPDALNKAGPLALLFASPDVILHIFHYDG